MNGKAVNLLRRHKNSECGCECGFVTFSKHMNQELTKLK